MRTCAALFICGLFLYPSLSAQTKYFSDWPEGADPKTVATQLAEHFVASPHQGTFVTYQEVCAWHGALGVAKATGNTAGIPTIAFDLSAMKNGIIGSSGERLRAALGIIDAVSGGHSLWLATCNSIASLPPELRRRFTLGTFFFDLPSPEEREVIWRIYTTKYQIAGCRPEDENWTGAEIRECCRKASRLRISLEESASYIVPVARSAAEQIDGLRQQSSGKYLSASHPGVYEYSRTTPAPRGRAFRALSEG